MSKNRVQDNTKYNPDRGKVNLNKTLKTIKNTVVYKHKHTRNEIFSIIADNLKISNQQVSSVFSELSKIIIGHLTKRGSGELIIPKTGIKIRRIKKKASKQRSMTSPLTGTEVTIAAKPVRLSVKLTALKFLKDAVTI